MQLPVSTAAMNGDYLGTAENADEALKILRQWWDGVRGGSADPDRQITGVRLSMTRWNVPVNGDGWADKAYVPITD